MGKSHCFIGLCIIAAAFMSSCGDSSAPAANDDVALSSSSVASSSSDRSSGAELSSSTMLSSIIEMSSARDMSSAIGASSSTPKISQSSSIKTSTPSSSARNSSSTTQLSSSAKVASSSADLPVTTAVRDCDYVENTSTTPVTGTLTCPNSEVYKTVKIGTAVWMAQNLNYGNRIDGSLSSFDDGLIEKYCYDDDNANCTNDGGLYQWAESMGFPSASNFQLLTDGGVTISTPHQGICPTGWHIPSASDWDALVTALGGDSSTIGSKMKLNNTSFASWNSLTAIAINGGNSSGFSAFPAGRRGYGGSFDYRGEVAYFWEAAEYNVSYANYRNLYALLRLFDAYHTMKSYGFSVRCVKDP